MNPYQSIYRNMDFNETPYDSNDKFSVYITKDKDYIEKLIEKDENRKKMAATSQSQRSATYNNWDLKPIPNNQDDHRPRNQPQEKQTGDEDFYPPGEGPHHNESQNGANTNGKFGGSKLPRIGKGQRRLKFSESRSPPKTAQQFQRKKPINNSTVSSSSNSDIDKLRSSLYFDERTKTIPKTTLKNNIIEDIVRKGDTIVGNRDLLESIYKLKNLNLLKSYSTHVQRYKGVGKLSFIYNDYHTKATNPGYSRSKLGTFYTR